MEKIGNFRDRLFQSMTELNLTQIELSEKAGISKSLLNKYLKGVSEAGNTKLLLLANALNVNPLWLMGYDVNKYHRTDVNKETTEKEDLIKRIEIECNNASIEELKTILRVIKSIIEKK